MTNTELVRQLRTASVQCDEMRLRDFGYLMKTASEAIPQWIPVTERLPERLKYVLVRYKNNDMAVACWFDGDEDILFWRAMTDEGWCSDCDTDPTHWMPLPEPPKGEN